ncbi:cysteine--1-D-myo-inosityl 2-amino-2-deoxy-alpha-D-glucopyranoside ligase [Corynebacterium otitidis]|uniref:cysteine--1-D-myo-inosityl 2-amino-2-deoxy-alpha-D-glucopyranoside ligase n=1 Tax=Corynebacterium otitidis TaxID=29321 RepID=UPI00062800B4|nr:cysteine--1-D-myo-inosityl 2-amino-2-deoxy-alpha-D-glucopyranoside ligase [Corynebacterium otitidis]KKO84579.1 cysteine--1-D-myo-inosityl 2-amino-2-deoxy-alpha-D-glucopyranoside ligase [Corynebacterium otitidis]
MQTWSRPDIPTVPGQSSPLRLYDTADREIREVDVPEEGPLGLYVCGITPYDSTHLGHAATYLAFDLINRQLLDNGVSVRYAQNVTDVDDPLFERAERDNVDWRELGDSQVEKFRGDMAALRVLPPDFFVGATEVVDEIVEIVGELLDKGAAYVVDDDEYPDVYASREATARFGYVSNYSDSEMAEIFPERGGDPDRPGKRDPLDALIWRAHRDGEPAWDSPFGPGRPGWHIECAAIAANRLGVPFAINGGGSDLAFPHHEYSAAHAEAARGVERMAGHYVHAGMISLDGTKMSKSLGNLVFVKDLTDDGHEPDAIRASVYDSHYRGDRDWSAEILTVAERRLARWRAAASQGGSDERARAVVAELRERLADDLDSPGALRALDTWADEILPTGAEAGPARAEAAPLSELPASSRLVAAATEALLGIRLGR